MKELIFRKMKKVGLTNLFNIILIFICEVCFSACKDREKQYIYYDEGKTKPKEIYEIDRETGLRDGSCKIYLKSGAQACSLEFVEGEVKAHSCEENAMVDLRDYQVYRTVKIGNQVLMAENLNYEMDNSFCYVYDDSNSCEKYGRHYRWTAAKSACPVGWHLPTLDEWKTLVTNIDANLNGSYRDENVAGQKLKVSIGWNAYHGISNEDALGFSALPAGFMDYSPGKYYPSKMRGVGRYADFWSASQKGLDAYYQMSLRYDDNSAYMSDKYRKYAISVRCLKD
jgi:uncharacterized protein (TIGR02145 family)